MSKPEEKRIGRFGQFIDHGDGTVTDGRTGLMWKRASESAEWSGGITETFSFSHASAMRSDFSGYSDWRLPSIEELCSLLDNRLKPMLDDSVFAVQQGCYFWSSTLNRNPQSQFNGYAWVKKYAISSPCFGDVKTDAEHVRLVRVATRSQLFSAGDIRVLQQVETSPSPQSLSSSTIPVSTYRERALMLNSPPSLFGLITLNMGDGSGEVRRDPSASSYAPGQAVRLTAVAQPGSRFVGWRGDVAGGHFVCNLRMDSAKMVTAEFGRIEVTEGAYTTRQELVLATGTLQQIETKQVIQTGSAAHTLINTNGDALVTSKKYSEKRIGHFCDHGDGTITDTRTGLMWMRSAVGQTWIGDTAVGNASYHKFESSLELPSTYVGYDDWRLPSLSELQSLIEPRWEAPTIDICAFPNTRRSYFLTSSRVAEDESLIWRVNFADGKMDAGSLEAAVQIRFVRKCNGIQFPLAMVFSGNGNGSIGRDVEACDYPSGRTVTLTAIAAAGSKFNGWSGDATGQATVCAVKMDSAKTVAAVFDKIKSFALEVKLTGSGTGVATRSPDAGEYVEGTKVKLTARAAVGSKFNSWKGDATGQAAVCAVKMDSAKTISAEFDLMESYALQVVIAGTGQGFITRNIDTETYFEGAIVTLTAQATEGSIFSRWLGDAGGQEDVCTVQMNSAKLVTAEFDEISVPDFGIDIAFESAEHAKMKSGDDAIIFNLSVFNRGLKQIRVELPLSSYVNRLCEEIEQTAWLTGLLAGNKGAVIRAGTFRKMGLVFFKSRLTEISNGDCLHVTVAQSKPDKRICFTLKCIDSKLRTFMVVNAAYENQTEPSEMVETSSAMTSVLQRIALLEEGMANLLRKLDALPRDALVTVAADTVGSPLPAQTLQKVLTWLASQDRISTATFRIQLLPLDLLPSAIVNEINERALDLTGEIALEEVGDQFLVTGNVFDEVLANWDFTQS